MMSISKILGYTFFELLIPLSFTVAFVVFLWGSFHYFIAGGHDEESKEKGKSLIMYGLILFVLVIALWGVVRAIMNWLF